MKKTISLLITAIILLASASSYAQVVFEEQINKEGEIFSKRIVNIVLQGEWKELTLFLKQLPDGRLEYDPAQQLEETLQTHEAFCAAETGGIPGKSSISPQTVASFRCSSNPATVQIQPNTALRSGCSVSGVIGDADHVGSGLEQIAATVSGYCPGFESYAWSFNVGFMCSDSGSGFQSGPLLERLYCFGSTPASPEMANLYSTYGDASDSQMAFIIF